MMVTLAVAGPFTQSVSVTGGKIDSAVGPGVGFFVITVQPESGRKADWVGTVRTTVGAGRASVVAVAVKVGVACTWGRQPVKPTAKRINNSKKDFFIYNSMVSIQQFYQRKSDSGYWQGQSHTGLIFSSHDVCCGKLQAC